MREKNTRETELRETKTSERRLTEILVSGRTRGSEKMKQKMR